MKRFLAFNGDTDGICAAHQYLLLNPGDYTPITGVKRDINLLRKIETDEPASIVGFDVAVEKNLDDAYRLLEKDCPVLWFDHHVSDVLPENDKFSAIIDTNPLVNTSLIVSDHLKRPSLWAIVGLFGDNILETAESLSKKMNLGSEETVQLREMGELLNYNAYGETIDDLHLHPADILKSMEDIESPLDYLDRTSLIPDLRTGMKDDLDKAFAIREDAPGVFLFPGEKWARRAIGVFANRKARSEPDAAHAVLVEKEGGEGFTVSVRSPLNADQNAVDLCRQFPTGGGRIKAAGINLLEKADLERFVDAFSKHYMQ